MGQRAGGPFKPVELIGQTDRRDGISVIRVYDHDDAVRLLRGSKVDRAEMAELRRWCLAQDIAIGRNDEQLLSAVARAICEGRILVGDRLRIPTGAGGAAFSDGGAPVQDRRPPRQPRPSRDSEPIKVRDPAPRAPAARQDGPQSSSPASGSTEPSSPPSSGDTPPPGAEDKTWIEFCLLDEETGEPIANVTFRIELTDGSEGSYTTDGAGMIRIDDIDPGTCAILEIAAEDGTEVTEVS